VLQALAALPRPAVPGLRWTSPEQWHVTLRFFGEADPAAAREAFGRIGPVGEATAVLGPSTGRLGGRVLHAPVQGLEGLAAATVAATAGVGEPPPERPFAGHVTLARSRHPRGVDLRPLAGAPVAGRWMVRELTLVASRLGGAAGPRYEVVERLPLGAGA
jgi:2'-5' RNA ligase